MQVVLMQQKLAIFKIWDDLAKELSQKSGILLLAILIPTIAISIIEHLNLVVDFPWFLRLIGFAFYLVAISLVAVSCHRIILLGPDSMVTKWGVYWDNDLLNYIGALIFVAVCTAIIAVVLMFPMMAFVMMFSAAGGLFEPLNFLMLALVWVCIAYVMARISILLPARAVGDTTSFAKLFDLSKGNGWRLTIATMLPVFVIGALISSLTSWIFENPGTASLIPTVLLSLIYSMITICLLSCAYRALLQLHSRKDTEADGFLSDQ